ncbi:AraC family transcriptional regulator [Rhizobium redzepovicii]|uniref:AraC family transcriptional regulator n=1 Tax=Rhizobium redzepovicii TaxID=2867518 RepID=UPI001C9354B6|nr:AraC family transcriptional regulator [Rhizobium redzepovicii]MBY4618299.1 helix-turn-helix domain-containing protein [Rhizobium redzepovicii]
MSDNSPAPFSFRFRGSSFDNMVETLGGAFGAFDAEPVGRAQDFHWGLDFSANDSAVLLTGYHAAEFQFNIEPTVDTAEYLSIVVPRSGGMGVAYGSRVAEAGEGKLLLYNNFEPDSVLMYGQSNVIDELLINWSVILQTIGQTFEMPFSGSLDLLPELDLSTPVGRTIGNLTETIAIGMRDNGPLLQSPIAMAHITQALADLVVRMVPNRLSHFLDKGPALIAPRHVRKAIEFMQANIDQPITMPKVAEAAGVSSRALETGFRAFRGTSPAVYLLTLRLRAARQELLDPESKESMKGICLKWGFFHFGRFSAVYKSTYGEYPSDTRKRVCRL